MLINGKFAKENPKLEFKIGLLSILVLGFFLHAKPIVPEGGAVSVASFLFADLPNGAIASGTFTYQVIDDDGALSNTATSTIEITGTTEA